MEAVDALDLGQVLQDGVLGFGIIGKPTLVSLHAFPKARLPNVISENARTEIDIVFDLKEVNTFPISGVPPSWQMNLHDPDGLAAGDGERIRPAFDDNNTGDQSGIQIVFLGTANNRFRHAVTVRLIDPISFEKSFY